MMLRGLMRTDGFILSFSAAAPWDDCAAVTTAVLRGSGGGGVEGIEGKGLIAAPKMHFITGDSQGNPRAPRGR